MTTPPSGSTTAGPAPPASTLETGAGVVGKTTRRGATEAAAGVAATASVARPAVAIERRSMPLQRVARLEAAHNGTTGRMVEWAALTGGPPTAPHATPRAAPALAPPPRPVRRCGARRPRGAARARAEPPRSGPAPGRRGRRGARGAGWGARSSPSGAPPRGRRSPAGGRSRRPPPVRARSQSRLSKGDSAVVREPGARSPIRSRSSGAAYQAPGRSATPTSSSFPSRTSASSAAGSSA